jgi:hypothetical protein
VVVKLAEMQRLFHQLATRAPGSEAVDPSAFLAGTPALDARARVGIYADMFIWRQIDALREDFPKLALLIGDAPFYAMAEEYLREKPSRHASLSELGRELPGFLREWSGEGARADLADLAVLEFAHDLQPLWQGLEEGAAPGQPLQQQQWVAVWRKEFDVLHAPIDDDEAQALALARLGEPLGAVCEAFARRSDAVEAAFRAISSWFVEGWILAGPEETP